MITNDNTLRTSDTIPDPTKSLPPEVLAIIFKYACRFDKIEDPKRKLILGSVCSRWRRILWSSPHLWMSFYHMFRSHSNLGIVKLIELHASNSVNNPLSYVLLWDHNELYDNPTISLAACFLIFAKYATRIRSLHLWEFDETTWSAIIAYSRFSEFPQLESLDLTFMFDDQLEELTSWFARMPKLHWLALHHPCFDVHEISPLTNITTLILGDLHPDHAFYLLSQFPNLVKFETSGTTSDGYLPETIPDPPLTQDVVLPHLAQFSWNERTYLEDIAESTSFIHHIRLPAIRCLQWSWYLNFPPTHWDVWKCFFQNMDGLESIKIGTHAPHVIPDLLSLFSTQHIREVEIYIYSVGELRRCLHKLMRSRNARRASVLPHLDVLELYFPWDIGRDKVLRILSWVVTMLKSRRISVMQTDYTAIRRFRMSEDELLRVMRESMDIHSLSGQKSLRALKALHDEGLDLHQGLIDFIVTHIAA
ncbi:hypothetical protein D9756_002829 [Leucocoprinus leucothites]|uniref:F-box domain-containing protein n=1 Tax=Leucocoprinus leucothites TaxID=201217 RepID=A0A8H5GBX8_9AGAR|nr:hypothetical protein D9756_002829 [Leucoagaricus leucothites]